MNIQEYLQMKAIEDQQAQQGSGAPSGEMPPQQQMPQQAPRRNPLQAGSREAIEAVRESLGNRASDFERGLGRLSANIGRGLYAKSGTPFGQQMAQIAFDPYEAEDARIKENMEILDYLHKKEQMQLAEERDAQHMAQQYLMHQEALAEQAKHHRAAEDMQRALHRYEVEDATEGRALADRIKQETGDVVQPMSMMKPQMQSYANKEIRTYAQKATSAAEAIETSNRMKQIINSPIGKKILNNWNFVVAYRYAKDPSYVNQLMMNLKMNEKEKNALMEMAALAKNFNIRSLEGLPGNVRANQMIEREMFSANPNARMPAKALINTLNKADDSLNHSYGEYSKASEYGDAGFLYKPKARKLGPGHAAGHSNAHAEPQTQVAPQGFPPISELSDEELNQLYSGGQ